MAYQLILICSVFILSSTSIFGKGNSSLTDEMQFELLLEQLARDYGQSIDADILEYYHDRRLAREPDNLSKIISLPLIDETTAFYLTNYPNVSIEKVSQKLLLSSLQTAILSNTLVLENSSGTQLESEIEEEEDTPEGIKLSYKLRSIIDLEEKQGFADSTYLGDRVDYYQRLSLGYGDFSSVLLTSKDAGELSYTDFISGGLSYQTDGYGMFVGDYIREWGAGGLNWRRFGGRKGGETISIPYQNSDRTRINTSSIPDGVMRGTSLFAEYDLDNKAILRASAWYSDQRLSGNVVNDSLVQSVIRTGFHRTQNDLDKKSMIGERVIGVSSYYEQQEAGLGVAFQNISYDKALDTDDSRYFDGESTSFLSATGSYNFNDQSDGLVEVVGSNTGNYAIISTFRYTAKKLSSGTGHKYLLNFRYLSEEYKSPYANPFSEFSGTADEIGLYLGYRFIINKGISLSTFVDIYQSSKARRSSNLPVRGWEWLSQLRVAPERDTEFVIRAKLENKFDRFKLANSNIVDNELTRLSARADYIKNLGRYLRLRVRGEYSALKVVDQVESSEGYLVSSELDYQLSQDLKVGGRYTIFSTDDFNSAMWQYEYVFPGYSTTPVLYGRGSRATVEVAWEMVEGLRLSGRYAIDYKRGTNPFGSSGESILGNQRSNLAFQIDYDL